MKARDFGRELSLWERGTFWLVAGGVVVVAIVVLGLVGAASGTFRGHTAIGLGLGGLALGAAFASGWYSVRKRRKKGGNSSMMAWLWAHVSLGLVALVAAVMHAGPASLAPRFTSGWALLLVFVVLVGSGLWWRVIYLRVPRELQDSLGGPNPEASRARAAQYEVEIEKLAAGRSEVFQGLKGRLLTEGGDAAREADRLAPAERQAFEAMARLATKRRDVLARVPKQERASWRMQGWRWLHVPLVGLMLVLIPVHLGGAAELPARVFPASGFDNVSDCASCHAGIVEQWQDSMHAHALRSPVTIVQNNVAVRDTLKGEQRRVCVNCHGPVGAMLDGGFTLPFGDGSYDRNAGIDCVTCHQVDPKPGGPGHATLWERDKDPGALAFGLSAMGGLEVFQDFYAPGRTYFGGNAAPVGNSFHRSAAHPVFERDGDLCASCHNVHLDFNGDGRIVKGQDLVLQTLVQEWEDKGRAKGACVDCHMPQTEVKTVDRFPWMGVDGPITRTVRSHTFVGVDYPLDAPLERTHVAERKALLAGAATIGIEQLKAEGNELKFDVRITNSGSGHNLPSGFAFARQLWLEVVVEQGGVVVFESGVLPKVEGGDDVTADLCDKDTMDDVLGKFVQRCEGGSDPQLVNLQGILLDKIAQGDSPDGPIIVRASDGHETPVQFPTSGPIARTRPSTGAKLKPLEPGDSGRYAYAVKIAGGGAIEVRVRLRFRNLPPYFLRALNARRVPGDVDLEPLMSNLQVIDMQTAPTATLTRGSDGRWQP